MSCKSTRNFINIFLKSHEKERTQLLFCLKNISHQIHKIQDFFTKLSYLANLVKISNPEKLTNRKVPIPNKSSVHSCISIATRLFFPNHTIVCLKNHIMVAKVPFIAVLGMFSSMKTMIFGVSLQNTYSSRRNQ